MDAFLCKEDIIKQFGISVTIEPTNNLEDKTTFTAQPRLSKIFKHKEGILERVPDIVLDQEDTDYVRLSALVESRDSLSNVELRDQIQEAINSRENNDPVKGWLTLKKAYLSCRIGNKGIAKDIFKKVANGEIAASKEHRLEAMTRVGKLCHAEKNRVEAYRAFKEIVEVADTPQVKAEAMEQIAALTMELARSGKGTLGEARMACKSILEEVPESMMYHRVIAELMHMETWFYEKDYEQCITEGLPLLTKWGSTSFNREKSMCMIFIGTSYYKLGDLEKASEMFEQILSLDIKRKWKVHDPKAKALNWLILLAKKQDNQQLWNHWVNLKDEMFPAEEAVQ